MQLVVFDIDGTLTDTNHVDGLAFLEAWKAVYQIENLSTRWSDYSQSTDSGIFEEVFEKNFGVKAEDKDRALFRSTFVDILKKYSDTQPDFFKEVSGAKVLLDRLSAEGIAVSLATGAWRDSGLTKLMAAGLDVSSIPIASAEDSLKRSEILQRSIERALVKYQPNKEFSSVTYIGDGIWDWHASKEVGVRFVGRSDRGSLLGKVPGDIVILNDYIEADNVVSSLLG